MIRNPSRKPKVNKQCTVRENQLVNNKCQLYERAMVNFCSFSDICLCRSFAFLNRTLFVILPKLLEFLRRTIMAQYTVSKYQDTFRISHGIIYIYMLYRVLKTSMAPMHSINNLLRSAWSRIGHGSFNTSQGKNTPYLHNRLYEDSYNSRWLIQTHGMRQKLQTTYQ